ncbi:MAG: TspO/MBR family protein [Methylocystaceae bacterium]
MVLVVSNLWKFLISILVAVGAGFVGSRFTIPNLNWYHQLQKPGFAPPNSWFGPVWSVLYLLMGVSTYLVWQAGTGRKDVQRALLVFVLQLVFNVLWSVVFFGLQSPLGGLATIVILWLLIIWMIIAYYRVKPWAGLMNLPYLLWVTFAMVLNFSIWRLNA